MAARTFKIGDLLEIKTAKGFAYAQLTHMHDTYGTLLRVLPGLYESRPDDISALADQREQYVAFVALPGLMKSGALSVINNVPVPEWARKFPLFRTGTPGLKTTVVDNWSLWDGERSWKVGKLTDDQRLLPKRGIWGDQFLIDRLESGWLPDPADERAV
jgi:hypothetical protein